MPNTNTPGHIAITVGSTKTKLQVNPGTYSMVDVVDYAPRAVSGTPSFSTLGLYTDVAQDGFSHGFGEWEFKEPKSYSYSGQGIDTRHGHIQLYTKHTTVVDALAGFIPRKLLIQNGVTVMATSTGVSILKPSDGTYLAYSGTAFGSRDMISNGKYLIVANDGRLKLLYIAKPSVVAGTTLTFSTAAFENTDQWATVGKVWVFDGTGVGTVSTIASSTPTNVVVTAWAGDAPTTDSWVMLIADAGKTANPPNNFSKLAVFGGNVWGAEQDTNYLHFWAETNALDAEGGGLTDAGAITVGPVGNTIANIYSFANQLYVFRYDGVWVVNEQDTDALAYHTLDYTSEVSTLNFNSVLVWQGFLIYSVRNNLYKYKTGMQLMTPPVWNEYPPYKQFGNYRGLLTRGPFLYCLGQSNAANSDETTETTTGFVSLLVTNGVGWHKLFDIPVITPAEYNAWLDPVGDYIYLYAKTAGGLGSLFRIPLQSLSDLAYPSYPTSGTYNLYTSYYDFGMTRIPKSFAGFTLHGELPTGTTVAVAYRVDSATAWTTLGTITTDFQELLFPVGVTGKRIQLRLTLATTNASNTPFIRAIVLKFMIRPTVKWGVNCDILVADDLSDQYSLVLGHTAIEIKTNLMAARDSVTPITFVDIYGTTYTAYLASCRFLVIAYEDSDAVQSIAHATFVMI